MKPRVRKIERRRLSDHIIRQLLALVTKDKLKIGEKLPPEHVLMEQFGVGRSSLREAMGALSLMGVVSIKPGQGTHIIASSNNHLENLLRWDILKEQHKFRELIEARNILEQSVVELVIKRANEIDIAELRSKLGELESAKTNRRRYNKVDLSFHMALAKISHNDILAEILSHLRLPILASMERYTASVSAEVFDKSVKHHAAILKAIEARDTERAKSLIRKHLEWFDSFVNLPDTD